MLGSTRHASLGPAVGACALGVALVVSGCGSSSTEPAPLQLSSRSSLGEAALSADSSLRLAAGVPTPTPGTTWPPTPVDGPVLIPSSAGVSTARVQALALSLGITDPVVEKPGGWITPSSDEKQTKPQLIVVKDERSTWSFGTGISCNLDVPATDAGGCSTSSVAVAVAPDAVASSGTGGGTPVPPDAPTSAPVPSPPPTASATPTTPSDPALTESVIAQLADPVFTAAGLGADAERSYLPQTCIGFCAASGVATADPVVAGLPTYGASTSVAVGQPAAAGGTSRSLGITSASGILGSWTVKDQYGLISATDALKRLALLPQPAIAELCPVTPDGQGCAPRPTPTITGARFGLMADTDGNNPVLAPAWLYATTTTYVDGALARAGTSEKGTIAISAVQDRFIATPAPPTGVATDDPVPPPIDVPGSAGGGVGTEPGSGGSAPGDPGPDPVGTPEPAPANP